MPPSHTPTELPDLAAGGPVSRAHPLILCYDGSEDAKRAIEHAGALFSGSHALVLTVWRSTTSLGSVGWSGATVMPNFAELDNAAFEAGATRADEGVSLARRAGLEAEPLAVEADGPIWEAIVETADRRQAAVIVLGCRGLTGLRSILLGSVSGTVVHQAHRPTLVIHGSGDQTGRTLDDRSVDARRMRAHASATEPRR
ncbi:MAG: universal stress protein [Actinobacteria bacterium]|nr:universal stress protein [Actinomycetota bacterium]